MLLCGGCICGVLINKKCYNGVAECVGHLDDKRKCYNIMGWLYLWGVFLSTKDNVMMGGCICGEFLSTKENVIMLLWGGCICGVFCRPKTMLLIKLVYISFGRPKTMFWSTKYNVIIGWLHFVGRFGQLNKMLLWGGCICGELLSTKENDIILWCGCICGVFFVDQRQFYYVVATFVECFGRPKTMLLWSGCICGVFCSTKDNVTLLHL